MSDRDGFDAALREALRRADASASGACPDEESLGAVVDGALGRRERRRLDEHLAGCARCRETLHHLRDASDAAAEERRIAGSRTWRPMIAALATASVGVVLAIRFFPETVAPVDRSIRDAVRPSASQREAAHPPAALGRRDGEATAGDGAKVTAPVLAPRSEPADRQRAEPAQPPFEPRAAASEPRRSLAAKSSLEGVPPPDGEGLAVEEKQSPADSRHGGAVLDSDRATSDELREQAPAEGAGGFDAGLAGRFEASRVSPPRTWRITREGTIERRSDAGTDWRTVDLAGSPSIAAVDGVSARIAWAVAARGVVLRTLDGEDWSRVTTPTDEDLIAVTATDAERATVETRSGARFATDDGGRTWIRR